MKHFDIYRKIILTAGGAAAVFAAAALFTAEDPVLKFSAAAGIVLLCGLLFLTDYLHCRYNDDLLKKITLRVEALVEQQTQAVFSEAEDTLTARLSHQLLKVRYFLTAQNQMLAQE